MNREDGYYWVRNGKDWIIAEYCTFRAMLDDGAELLETGWYVCDSEQSLKDSDFAEIGAIITREDK